MKKILIILVILISNKGIAQDLQKKYKYILVPVQYGFTNKANEFQLNVLTRVRLKEEGFEVYMSEGEKKPEELLNNQCLALKANVLKDSGILTTTLKFQLRDCFGKLLYESAGTSRLKAFKDAYQEALNIALKEFQSVSNQYLKTNSDEVQTTTVDTDINTKNIPFEERAVAYKLEEQSYWLLEKEDDYVLYLDKGKTVHATLESAGQGTFTYDSFDIDGAAYFNTDGDMIVEYLAKNKDAVQKLIFKKQ